MQHTLKITNQCQYINFVIVYGMRLSFIKANIKICKYLCHGEKWISAV